MRVGERRERGRGNSRGVTTMDGEERKAKRRRTERTEVLSALRTLPSRSWVNISPSFYRQPRNRFARFASNLVLLVLLHLLSLPPYPLSSSLSPSLSSFLPPYPAKPPPPSCNVKKEADWCNRPNAPSFRLSKSLKLPFSTTLPSSSTNMISAFSTVLSLTEGGREEWRDKLRGKETSC